MRFLLYNLLMPVAFVLYSPVFLWKLFRRGGFVHHFGERFGAYSLDQRARLDACERPVWIHAVSVGEAVAALSFIRRWQERRPDLRFVLSTTTTTGHAVAEKKLPDGVVLIYAPVDFLPMAARALSMVRPCMVVIFEVEIWPNLIWLTHRRGIPIVLANGRMSDRSAKGFAKHRWFFGEFFAKFASLCVQTDQDASRVRTVSGESVPIHVCSTMKFDQVPDSVADDQDELLRNVFGPGDHVVWTVGSTHGGEEALVLDVLASLKPDHPELRVILVPRHCERTAEVCDELDRRHVSYRLLVNDAGERDTGPDAPVDVLLVNTTGELMGLYGVADLVYVGKSLAGNTGGHNIIEPAIFAKPIVHGNHMENFREVARLFHDADAAVEVGSDAELAPAVRSLVADSTARHDLGRRARELVDRHRGAVDRTIDILEQCLAGTANAAGAP